MLKIATWNVNSLKVRLPQVLEWLQTHQPDVLALQETKTIDELFPLAEINNAGYECVFSGQKAYNGVAILTKKKCQDVHRDLPGLEDPQRRVLGVTIDDVRVLNLYVPNGETITSEKYGYKLRWLDHLQNYLNQEAGKYKKFIILGDFNIAPHDRDVHDPARFLGQVLCSDNERAAFNGILQQGFVDCFRHLYPETQEFSWWDYRLYAFKRNLGVRIDHILASSSLALNCKNCYIDKAPRAAERPSDHAPVIAHFETLA